MAVVVRPGKLVQTFPFAPPFNTLFLEKTILISKKTKNKPEAVDLFFSLQKSSVRFQFCWWLKLIVVRLAKTLDWFLLLIPAYLCYRRCRHPLRSEEGANSLLLTFLSSGRERSSHTRNRTSWNEHVTLTPPCRILGRGNVLQQLDSDGSKK